MKSGHGMNGTETTRPHWTERCRAGARRAAEFMAEYGADIGLGGGSVLMAVGVGASVLGAGTSDPALEMSYLAGSKALLVAGVIKMGAFYGAEKAARLHLQGVDYLFDDAKYREAAYGRDDAKTESDPRSSAPIAAFEEDVLADPVFRRAIQTVFQELQGDPGTRHDLYKMLASNPAARTALMEAQSAIETHPNIKSTITEQIRYPEPDSLHESPGV